jgi:hypothetical protein
MTSRASFTIGWTDLDGSLRTGERTLLNKDGSVYLCSVSDGIGGRPGTFFTACMYMEWIFGFCDPSRFPWNKKGIIDWMEKMCLCLILVNQRLSSIGVGKSALSHHNSADRCSRSIVSFSPQIELFFFWGNLWNIVAECAYYSDTSWGLEKCIIEMKRKSRQTR